MASTSDVAKNETMLHTLVKVYSEQIERLKHESSGMTYVAHFLTPDLEAVGLKGEKMSDAQAEEYHRVYLLGVLERCHLTSVTSLARTNGWLRSSLSELENGNLLGFSASLRGLLEAAADTHDAASVMVDQLYNFFPFIYLRLQRNNTASGVVLKLLEDRLIHYSYARRQVRSSEALPEHNHKYNTEYIAAIEKSGAAGAKDLYSVLCELTHPAAPSVSCFLKETEREITLDFSQEKRIISEIVSDYEETIKSLVSTTVNSALVSLVVLRKLGYAVPAPNPNLFSGMTGIVKIFSRIDEFLLKASGEGFVFSKDMWHYKF